MPRALLVIPEGCFHANIPGFFIERSKAMDELKHCTRCEAVQTDLGVLMSLDESVKKNFPLWLPEKQQDLVIMWYDKIKSKEMAVLIQSYKTKNIKDIK